MAAGRYEPFSRDKLLLSLYKSCEHRKDALSDAASLTDTVIKKLLTQVQNGVINRTHIIQVVQVALNRFDKAASVHYTAFHKS
jgi:transcriptional regulator NrdR family protein